MIRKAGEALVLGVVGFCIVFSVVVDVLQERRRNKRAK